MKEKIIKLINELIMPRYAKPKKDHNWFSHQFYWWLKNKQKIFYDEHRNALENIGPHVYFHVEGAGDVCMSWTCGNKMNESVGFTFDAQWGINLELKSQGGIIDREEAKKMARFILQRCEQYESQDPKRRL